MVDDWLKEAMLIMGFLGAVGGLWWRLEQYKKSAADVVGWRQSVEDKLGQVDKEIQRLVACFKDHLAVDREHNKKLNQISERLVAIETVLEYGFNVSKGENK